jgi:hypothetical protein
MSTRRIIKKDPFTKTNVTINSTSTGNTVKDRDNPRAYFKRNFIKAVELITPIFYIQDDLDLSGAGVSQIDQLLNSHIVLCENAAAALPVSSIPNDLSLSGIDAINGLSRFFISQNQLTNITPNVFQRDILYPLGKAYSQYATSAEFLTYISGTFLPSVSCPEPDSGIPDLTNAAFSADSSGTHKFLIQKLSWLYFLNRKDPVTHDSYSTSAEVAKLIASNLYFGKSISLSDCIRILESYLWRNYSSLSSIDANLVPDNYVSSLATSAGPHVSGTQLESRLHTLVDILYSPSFYDLQDDHVKTSLQNYMDTSSNSSDKGSLITDEESKGPLYRFLKAISFSLADRESESEELSTLIDIENCPDSFLELLGELIGWKLLGDDPSRWRLQLRNAVDIYKAKGTKKSIQMFVDALFGADVFNVSGTAISELWESYLPNMLYYALATDSSFFDGGFTEFTPQKATDLGLSRHSSDDMDENLRLSVDRIIEELLYEFPENFIFAGDKHPGPQFVEASAVYAGPGGIGTPVGGTPPGGLGATLYYPGKQILIDGAVHNLVPTDVVYEGPWHRMEDDTYMTGTVHIEGESEYLLLRDNPGWTFEYRGQIHSNPPWEMEKYYRNCTITSNFLKAVKRKLICFGVTEVFAQHVLDYIKEHVTETTELTTISNGWLMFTPSATTPLNFSSVVANIQDRTPNPINYLSLWNGKSSHFKIVFNASSFDFTNRLAKHNTGRGVQQVLRTLDQVIPAHSIPEAILDVSSVADGPAPEIASKTCTRMSPYTSVSDGYYDASTSLHGFGACATDVGADRTTFKRSEVDSSYESRFTRNNFLSLPRNAIRRRSFKSSLPLQGVTLRDGKGTPGNVSLSAVGFTSSIGCMPLGFVPSAMSFESVPLKSDPAFGFGNLLDTSAISEVWGICENLHSSNTYFEVDTSNTFPSRGKTSPAPSACFNFLLRDNLNPMIGLMHKVLRFDKLTEASSIVSGYYNTDGSVNVNWDVSSPKISPVDLSSWHKYTYLDIVGSIANQLEESEISNNSLNNLIHFKFGKKLNKFYNEWLDFYNGDGLNLNYKTNTGPDILTHTYGPYIYNYNFSVDGSAIGTDGIGKRLVASSLDFASEVDICWGGGSGVLSPSGGVHGSSLGSVSADATDDIYVQDYEWRNEHLVSSIEFIDTSGSESDLFQNPTFSLIRLDRSNDESQSKGTPDWGSNRFLVDNLLIKHIRPANQNRLPRLKVKINPASTDNTRNFLIPDHDYNLKIDALNMDLTGMRLGGQKLGVWIHTKTQTLLDRNKDGSYTSSKYVWSYTPKGAWEKTKVSMISGESTTRNTPTPFVDDSPMVIEGIGANGVNTVKSLSHTYQFPSMSVLDSQKEPPTAVTVVTPESCRNQSPPTPVATGAGPPPVSPDPRLGCAPEKKGPISKVNTLMFNSINIPFNTNNWVLSDEFCGCSTFDKRKMSTQGQSNLHTTSQEYFIEIFAFTPDESKFILFNKIEMEDLTWKDAASVERELTEYSLQAKDLRTAFEFYNYLRDGVASRDAFSTSSVFEASGGSRINYRSDPAMYVSAISSGHNQLTSIEIKES